MKTIKCYHEVPCTCSTYLNKLTIDELENLKIQFGKLPKNSNFFERFYSRVDVKKIEKVLKIKRDS